MSVYHCTYKALSEIKYIQHEKKNKTNKTGDDVFLFVWFFFKFLLNFKNVFYCKTNR